MVMSCWICVRIHVEEPTNNRLDFPQALGCWAEIPGFFRWKPVHNKYNHWLRYSAKTTPQVRSYFFTFTSPDSLASFIAQIRFN